MEKPFESGTDPAWLRDVIVSARRTADELTAALSDGEPASRSIPGYQILREIHRGAQGVVYQAIQRATQRKVAIKLLSSGEHASPRSKARFRREIRVLGQFRHPNIVSVHDSGSADGSFYYVMDYVSGDTLDAFMAGGERTVEESLSLFAKICEAVNAAHLRGIIHRDLKPGNILIDREGEPQIVDFGLAKVSLETFGEAEHTQFVSRTGEFTGSLPWASPEQASGDTGRIDIRTDVYSLGVVLFQMLTRTFPYAVAGNLRDVLDNILQAEPIRPRTLRRDIDSDVETMILKALAKDPDRRYQSAGELARDIRAYLGGEAISAKRDSTLYIIGKKIRRHRAPIAVTTVAFMLLVGFGSTLLIVRQRAFAAEGRAARIQMTFFERVLESIDPNTKTVASAGIMPDLIAEIEAGLADYPLIQARCYEKIGNVFRQLGAFEEARPNFEKALATRRVHLERFDPEIAKALHHLGALNWDVADYAGAEAQYREALEIRRAAFGEAHVSVAETKQHLAITLRARGRMGEAADLLREVLTLRIRLLGREHAEVAAVQNELAVLLMETGKYAEAEPLFRLALARVVNAPSEQLRGEDRPQYIGRAQTSLGACLVEVGELDEAEALLLASLEGKREMLGDSHVSVSSTLHWLAKLRLRQDRLADAELLAREAVDIRRAAWPMGHPFLAGSLGLLGEILLIDERAEQAAALLAEALEMHDARQPPGYWLGGHVASLLGAAMAELNESIEAEALLMEGVETLRLARGDADPYTQLAVARLTAFYRSAGRSDSAEAYEQIIAPSGAGRD